MRKQSGQTAAAYEKYKEAIEACGDISYIEFNVSQIARIFDLNPSSLANQLRNHYPEILKKRENERLRLGVNDNMHRGVKPWCKKQYAEAIEHLRNTEDTIQQTAELYGLSYPGLREHLLYYHKDLIQKRANKRMLAKTNKTRGELTGSGKKHEPLPQSVEKYRKAIHLYRTTDMTQEEICITTGVSIMGLRHYLRIWEHDAMLERYNVDIQEGNECRTFTKHYLKSTASKYSKAILELKECGLSTAEAARKYGLNPETFRAYLHEHEPELATSLGMTKLENGRLVLVRSAEKYDEAIRLYKTTTESLKSISLRLGLAYNSVGGFVRRNHPDAIKAHNHLIKQEKISHQKHNTLKCKKETNEKERIMQALEQTKGNKRDAAKLLGISKSSLYNKLNTLNLSKRK